MILISDFFYASHRQQYLRLLRIKKRLLKSNSAAFL